MIERQKESLRGRIPMAYKLLILMVPVLVAATALQGWLIAGQQSELLEKEILKFGITTARLLVRQIKEPLLAQDDLTLEQIIQAATKSEGVAGVEIAGGDGALIASSGVNPKNRRPLIAKPMFWFDRAGHRYISFIEIAQSSDLQVGELVLTIHADVLDQVEADAMQYILISTLLMIGIGVLMTAWLSRKVTKPIVRLIDISKQIAAGNYTVRFAEKRSGELGVLNDSLNVMTDKLLHKVHVEQTFSRYVSPQVAREVLAGREPQQLGGKDVNGSVLFADIIGFTALSEKMSDGDISQLLNDYFTYVGQAVYQCDGHVDKYMGDCAMILFGVPVAHSQHRVSAIYCALLIQAVIKRLNWERSSRGEVIVTFGIGVNAGPMLAGNMGSRSRMEYTVLGDTVNVASRLTSVSTQGEIVTDESIANLDQIKRQFISIRGDAVSLKGKSEPIKIHRIVGGTKAVEEQIAKDVKNVFFAIESDHLK